MSRTLFSRQRGSTADFSATYVRLGRQQLGQDVSCRRVKLGLEP